MEAAVLVPPWPDWVCSHDLPPEAAVVAVGSPLFSDDADALLPFGSIELVIGALSDPDRAMDAWIYTEEAYRRKLVASRSGECNVRALLRYKRKGRLVLPDFDLVPDPDEDALGAPGPAIACLAMRSVPEIGLPAYFIPFHPENLIGIGVQSSLLGSFALPEIGPSLEAYDCVVFTGGFHYADVLIGSTTREPDDLVRSVRAAFKAAGRPLAVRELSEAADYEALAAR